METNWQIKKLGEVCLVDWGNTNLTKQSYVSDGKFLAVSAAGGDGRINHFEHTAGTPVLSAIGANCGTMFFPNENFTAIKNTITFKVNHNLLDNRYLFSFLKSIQIPRRGGAQPFMSKGDIVKIEIPLPPLEEQKRIVKILDEKIGKIKEAIKLRKEAIADTEKILSRTLSEIFTEGKKKGWLEKEIKDICEHPQYGFTASSSPNEIGPKMLRITDIQSGSVNWATVPYCKCNDVEKYQLKKDDIVFARTGATVGKSFLIKEEPKNSVYASYLIRLRAKNDALAEFLYYFFQSINYWNQVNEQAVGGAQPNVNGTKLAKLKLFLPKIPEQKQIVQKLDSLSEKIKQLKELQTSQLSDLKRLEKSLLREAFNGGL